MLVASTSIQARNSVALPCACTARARCAFGLEWEASEQRGSTWDDTATRSAFSIDCLSNLNRVQVPPLFDKEAVRERLQALPGGPTQPLTVHLRQEIDRLNTVLALTTATLRNLRLAIAGASGLYSHLFTHASHPNCL